MSGELSSDPIINIINHDRLLKAYVKNKDDETVDGIKINKVPVNKCDTLRNLLYISRLDIKKNLQFHKD